MKKEIPYWVKITAYFFIAIIILGSTINAINTYSKDLANLRNLYILIIALFFSFMLIISRKILFKKDYKMSEKMKKILFIFFIITVLPYVIKDALNSINKIILLFFKYLL